VIAAQSLTLPAYLVGQEGGVFFCFLALEKIFLKSADFLKAQSYKKIEDKNEKKK